MLFVVDTYVRCLIPSGIEFEVADRTREWEREGKMSSIYSASKQWHIYKQVEMSAVHFHGGSVPIRVSPSIAKPMLDYLKMLLRQKISRKFDSIFTLAEARSNRIREKTSHVVSYPLSTACMNIRDVTKHARRCLIDSWE